MNISYEILKEEEYTMVLIFKKDEERDKLLLVLKNLRNEQNMTSE
ncbi:hypothetical protein [Legionella antarctica]